MSLLSELNTLLSPVLPVETGVFSGKAPDKYCFLTPMTDDFLLFGDNMPLLDMSEVRISVFTQDNYLALVKQIISLLLLADFTITGRQYVGHEDETKYNHYAIDVAKEYEYKED